MNIGGNLEWKRPGSLPFDLKAGAKFRRFTAGTRGANATYTYQGNDLDYLAALVDPTASTTMWGVGEIPWIDQGLAAKAVKASIAAGDGLWTSTSEETLQRLWRQNFKHGREDIISGYVMGTGRLGKLTILAGVRYEYTDIEASGYANATSTDTAYSKYTTNTASYGHFYPGIHLTYRFSKQLVARLDWSNSVGRAAMSTYMPTFTFSSTNETVTIGNPDVNPQKSMNWDANLTYYFKKNGSFSIGLFRKDLKDFLYSTSVGIVGEVGEDYGIPISDDVVDYDIIQEVNGGKAHIQGFELSLDQRLTFLPGLLKGLRLRANYSRMWTKGDYGETEAELPRFVPEMANIGLTYTYKKFSTTINWRYQSDELLNYYTAYEGGNIWQCGRAMVNLTLNYKFSNRLQFVVNWANIFNKNRRRYVEDRSRMYLMNDAGTAITVSVKGTF